MTEVVLDGARMMDRESMHQLLTERFQLPPHYGRNMDALWDVLTERTETISVRLLNPERMPADLQCPLTALLWEWTQLGDTCSFSVESAAIRPGMGGRFQGERCEIIDLALDTDTLEPLVVYRARCGVRVYPARRWHEPGRFEPDGEG